MLTMMSLFDGSGGFPLAAQRQGITPIYASEVEPFPIKVTRKRFPGMIHLGDVSKIDGAKLKPVDVVTWGSPCQDLSVAGKRAGLEGARSGLFFQAVRIVKEMRTATNGDYPRFIIWENVDGARSSSGGEDFRAVLESICQVADASVSIPRCEKWNKAGAILGDGFSVAWRVLDAQYWGVPQRRKRIYLVADFRGHSAAEILFERYGVPRNTAAGCDEGQGVAASVETSVGSADCTLYENNITDSRITEQGPTAPTVLSHYGTGGEQPAVNR